MSILSRLEALEENIGRRQEQGQIDGVAMGVAFDIRRMALLLMHKEIELERERLTIQRRHKHAAALFRVLHRKGIVTMAEVQEEVRSSGDDE